MKRDVKLNNQSIIIQWYWGNENTILVLWYKTGDSSSSYLCRKLIEECLCYDLRSVPVDEILIVGISVDTNKKT